MFVTYAMGSISVGYQKTDVDATAANEDIERTAYGISFAVNDNMSVGYSTTAGGATISAAADCNNNSATTSLAIQLPNLVEGFNIGAGIATDADSASTEQDIETMFVSYTMGSVSVGYQKTDVDATAASEDIERTAYGISFAVNDNMSIGYGVSDVEFEEFTPDEESTGLGAVYTSGGMTVGLQHIQKDNREGVTAEEEMTELQLTFAF